MAGACSPIADRRAPAGFATAGWDGEPEFKAMNSEHQSTSAGPRSAKRDPGPRRRLAGYTVSAKSREASRRNAVLAREAWLRIRRAPGFKPGAKLKRAAHANLLRAVAHKLRDCSHRYAGRFRHGLRAVSLERSLALAGETLEAYQAHVRWCCDVFGQGYEAASESMKLVLGFAYASWRRVRGLRTLAEWEMLAVCGELRRSAMLRRRGLERGAQGLVNLITMLRGILGEQFFLIPKLQRVENRLEALAIKLIEERGGEPPHWRARRSAVVEQHHRYPAEVLGNPLVPAKKAMAALVRREAHVKPPDEWKNWREGDGANWGRSLAAEFGLPPFDCLLRRAREREAEGRLELPATFEEFLKLVEEAVGTDAGRGHGQAPSENRQSADAGLVRAVAQELWRRLGIYRAQAEHEAEVLGEMQEAYPSSLEAGLDQSGDDWPDPCALARYLVAEVLSVRAVVREAKMVEYRLERALYRLVVQRHGRQSRFEELKPSQPDFTHLLITALMLNIHGNPDAAEDALEEHRKLTAIADG